MILANMRKEGSTASRARVQDFAQWPISTAGATMLVLARAASERAPDELERPNKKLACFQGGVAVLQNHFSSYQSALVQCTNIPG